MRRTPFKGEPPSLLSGGLLDTQHPPCTATAMRDAKFVVPGCLRGMRWCVCISCVCVRLVMNLFEANETSFANAVLRFAPLLARLCTLSLLLRVSNEGYH